MPDGRTAAIGVYVGVGGRDEPAALAGVSHALEHLVFKGSPRRSALDVARAIDAVGGEMNAYTSREHTAFYVRVPAVAWHLGLELLTDVLSEPALRPAEVASEREVILEELAAAEDDPDDVAHTALAAALYPDHPLGREVLGSAETIAAMTPAEIAGFHGAWYRSTNLVVAAAGAVDHDELCGALADFHGAGGGGEGPQRSAPVAAPVPEVTIDHPTEQAHLLWGWHAPDLFDPDRYALAYLNYVLGGGTASRLFQEVREERGLAYSVWSSPGHGIDSGSLTVGVATSPTKVAEVRSVVADVVGALATSGITELEHGIAFGFLEGSLVLGLEDAGAKMGRIGRGTCLRNEVQSVDEHLARFRAVTVDDVNRVAARVLGGPGSLVAVSSR